MAGCNKFSNQPRPAVLALQPRPFFGKLPVTVSDSTAQSFLITTGLCSAQTNEKLITMSDSE